jgi:hypothetical protein
VLGRAKLPKGIAGITKLHAMIGEHLGDEDEAEVIVGIETERGPWVQALVDRRRVRHLRLAPELRLAGPGDRRRRAPQQRDPVDIRRARPAAYVTNARGVDLVTGYAAHGLDTSSETAGADGAAASPQSVPEERNSAIDLTPPPPAGQSANTAMGVRVLSRRGLRSSR